MITLTSYNIRKAVGMDRARRPERVLDVIEEIAPDIVVLQEADRRFGARAAALPRDLIAARGFAPAPLGAKADSIGWHGNAILTRGAARIEDCGHIDLPALEPRGAVWADIAVGGAVLRVAGMHLDLSGLRRRQQARTILASLARLAPLPTVLMGDLNEWRPASGCLRDFAEGHTMARTGRSYPANRPLARLDRIMAGDGVRILHAAAHVSAKARMASDHLPVWARVAI